MFPVIIPALCMAVGAAAGGIAAHSYGEKDRQKAKHFNYIKSIKTEILHQLQQPTGN
jgi:hypothetical protein